MKKRSFFVLLAAAGLMLAGCTKGAVTPSNTDSSGGGSSSGSDVPPAVDIQPTEGKTTFYFTMGEGSVELASYTSVFLTGGFLGWKEAVGQAVEMQKLAGSDNVYVGLVDELEVGSTADKYYEFQLTLGYNATSGAPSTGVNWSYKSAECKAAGGDAGLDNLSFEVVNGLVNLGVHTWDELPPDPAASAIHNFKIEVKFAAAVPAYVDLYLVGDHAAWSFDDTTKLVPNDARTVFTQSIDTILGNTYGVKLMAQYAGQATDWNHCLLDDGTTSHGNYGMMVKKTWGDNYTLDLAAQACDAFVIPNETFEVEWATFMPELGEEVDVAVKLTAAAALSGTWEARGSWAASWDDPKALTANATNTEFTVDLGSYPAGNKIQFKLKLVSSWSVAIGDSTGANIEINVGDADMNVVVALDAALVAEVNAAIESLAAGTLAADYTAHAAVSGNGDAPAWTPESAYSIIGAFGGHNWDYDVDMAPLEGHPNTWSVSLELAVNDEFKIRTNHDWGTNPNYGFDKVQTVPTDCFADDGGNIKCLVADEYLIQISFTAEGVASIDIGLA